MVKGRYGGGGKVMKTHFKTSSSDLSYCGGIPSKGDISVEVWDSVDCQKCLMHKPENVSARGRVVHFEHEGLMKCGYVNANGLTCTAIWVNVTCQRCLMHKPESIETDKVIHFQKGAGTIQCGYTLEHVITSDDWGEVNCGECLKHRSALWDLRPNDRGWPTRDYIGTCKECKLQFSGHKRQLVCRSCEEYELKQEIEHLERHRDVAVSELENDRRKNNTLREEHRLIVEQKQRIVEHHIRVANRLRKALISTGMSPELVQVFFDE